MCVCGYTHVSTRFAVVASLSDGVERLLALHTQRHLFFPDWSWGALSQFCAVLGQQKNKCPKENTKQSMHVRTDTCAHAHTHTDKQPELTNVEQIKDSYRWVGGCAVLLTHRAVQHPECLNTLLMPLNSGLDRLKDGEKAWKTQIKKRLHIFGETMVGKVYEGGSMTKWKGQ